MVGGWVRINPNIVRIVKSAQNNGRSLNINVQLVCSLGEYNWCAIGFGLVTCGRYLAVGSAKCLHMITWYILGGGLPIVYGQQVEPTFGLLATIVL